MSYKKMIILETVLQVMTLVKFSWREIQQCLEGKSLGVKKQASNR